jgi:hypothetical protein
MSRSFVLSELRRFLFVVQNRLEMGGTATEKPGEKSDLGNGRTNALAVKRLLRRIFLSRT